MDRIKGRDAKEGLVVDDARQVRVEPKERLTICGGVQRSPEINPLIFESEWVTTRHRITANRTIDGTCLDGVVAPRCTSHRAKGLQSAPRRFPRRRVAPPRSSAGLLAIELFKLLAPCGLLWKPDALYRFI